MKVQELFEAADPEKSQLAFERNKLMPEVKKLLGSDSVRVVNPHSRNSAYDALDDAKPKKTKRLVWKDEGFDHVYELSLFDFDGGPVVKLDYNDYGGGTDPVYYVVKAAKVTEAVTTSPTALRAAIKKHLKDKGFKAASEESTAGALKTWFDFTLTKMLSMKALATSLKAEFPEQHVMFSGGKVMGDGFNLEQEEGGDGLYLAVFKKSSAGQEHKMGLDN